MSGADFWRTVRGVKLVDRTLPELVVELRRLNDHLDRLARGEQASPRPDKNTP
jgi:hypothetical protein